MCVYVEYIVLTGAGTTYLLYVHVIYSGIRIDTYVHPCEMGTGVWCMEVCRDRQHLGCRDLLDIIRVGENMEKQENRSKHQSTLLR